MPKKTKVVWITWSYQQRLRHRGIYSTSIETQQQEEIWLWSLFVFFFNLFLEAENNRNFKVWTKFDMVRLPGKTCLSNLLMTSNTWKTSRCVSVCVKHGLKPSENVQDECELTKWKNLQRSFTSGQVLASMCGCAALIREEVLLLQRESGAGIF